MMWSDSENGENKNICKTCEAPLTVQKRTERASKKEACERNEAIKVKTIKMKHGINNAAAVAAAVTTKYTDCKCTFITLTRYRQPVHSSEWNL